MKTYPSEAHIRAAYEIAKERYALLGVDTEQALDALQKISLSVHCWQGDDVLGLENTGEALSGGIAATGNYPGRARNGDELRQDLDKAYSLIPGTHRLSLHAMYCETDGVRVDRNELRPEHFAKWIEWAKANNHGVDFNPTCFSHPKAAAGLTLASYDEGIRQFWIEHCIASRKIGAAFGEALGTPSITNLWIPDGFKDVPADRRTPRETLLKSLDAVFAEPIDPNHNRDAVESKLFGLGVESYTVGSHEFYMGYAVSRGMMICLDAGHFHPTETISDKISATLLYTDELLLHVSRGVRWDSDHVVTLTDDLQMIAQEIVRGGYLDRVHVGLDFFDASINRIAAWAIGSRNTLRAMLMALLEPMSLLRELESNGDYSARLALLEDQKGLPFGAVWDYFCLRNNVPVGSQLVDEFRAYEQAVLSQRA
jgi:L-rhamnose isomerase